MDAEYVALWGEGPHDAADACVVSADGWVLLILRADGTWAMPGGFVEPGERTLDAALRELREETGLSLSAELCSGGVYRAERDRDPRAWIRTWVYLFEVGDRESVELRPADDARDAGWFPLEDLPTKMWADHGETIADLTRSLPAIAGDPPALQ